MTLVKHELRQGRLSFLVWTSAIGFLLATCIFIFPEMKAEMDKMSVIFSSLGSFTAAFGLDRLSFGTLSGYYALECGNILGLGGAFYAALCAISSLSKEEKERTAEFLLTHPISRRRIVTEKLLAVLFQITAMNSVLYALVLAAISVSGEGIPWREVSLLHLAYLILQLELAGICFAISAFMKKGSVAVGLGLVAIMYFLNLIANIAESVEPLKYLTPFGYCDGADIVSQGRLNSTMLSLGVAVGTMGILTAYLKYTKKDIQ